jgi:hypothetical protein
MLRAIADGWPFTNGDRHSRTRQTRVQAARLCAAGWIEAARYATPLRPLLAQGIASRSENWTG